jgi:hypothetical protein
MSLPKGSAVADPAGAGARSCLVNAGPLLLACGESCKTVPDVSVESKRYPLDMQATRIPNYQKILSKTKGLFEPSEVEGTFRDTL